MRENVGRSRIATWTILTTQIKATFVDLYYFLIDHWLLLGLRVRRKPGCAARLQESCSRKTFADTCILLAVVRDRFEKTNNSQGWSIRIGGIQHRASHFAFLSLVLWPAKANVGDLSCIMFNDARFGQFGWATLYFRLRIKSHKMAPLGHMFTF